MMLDFSNVRKEIESAIHAGCIEQMSLKNRIVIGERLDLVVENTLQDLRNKVSEVLQAEPQSKTRNVIPAR